MIKWSGTSKRGRKMIGLAITDMNIQRLKESKPIHIHADELGFEGEIVICYGKTEDDITRDLRELFTEQTRVRDYRGEKKN